MGALLPRLIQAIAKAQLPHAVLPQAAFLARDFDGEVHALQPRPACGLRGQCGNVEPAVGIMGDDDIGRALFPDHAGERAGVDARQADAAMRRHPFVERRDIAEIARLGHILPHDAAQRVRVVGLDILIIGADIADMGEGEIDDLPGIAGIGHDLLIAGDGRVEAEFAHRLADRAEAPSEHRAAIGENQYPGGSFGHGKGLGVCHGYAFPYAFAEARLVRVKRPVR